MNCSDLRWLGLALVTLVLAVGACGEPGAEIVQGSALTTVPPDGRPDAEAAILSAADQILDRQIIELTGSAPTTVSDGGPVWFGGPGQPPRGWIFHLAWDEPLSGEFERWPYRSCVEGTLFLDLHRVELDSVTNLAVVVDVAFEQIDRIDGVPLSDASIPVAGEIKILDLQERRLLSGEPECVVPPRGS